MACFFFRTAIGIRCKDGVVLAQEKLVTSKLVNPGYNRRIVAVEKHVGMVYLHSVVESGISGITVLFGMIPYSSVFDSHC